MRAADHWGDEGRVMSVRPGMPGSYETLFHAAGLPTFLLVPRDDVAARLREPRIERAIGVDLLRKNSTSHNLESS